MSFDTKKYSHNAPTTDIYTKNQRFQKGKDDRYWCPNNHECKSFKAQSKHPKPASYKYLRDCKAHCEGRGFKSGCDAVAEQRSKFSQYDSSDESDLDLEFDGKELGNCFDLLEKSYAKKVHPIDYIWLHTWVKPKLIGKNIHGVMFYAQKSGGDKIPVTKGEIIAVITQHIEQILMKHALANTRRYWAFTTLNPGIIQYISDCLEVEPTLNFPEPKKSRSKEKAMVNHLRSIPEIGPFIVLANKKVKHNVCDSNYRVGDLSPTVLISPLLRGKTIHVVVECDENNHKYYDATDEKQRMLEISMNLCGPDEKCVFVRFNPDSGQSIDELHCLLVDAIMNIDADSPDVISVP